MEKFQHKAEHARTQVAEKALSRRRLLTRQARRGTKSPESEFTLAALNLALATLGGRLGEDSLERKMAALRQ